jgi:hypothetical protein
MTEAELAAVEYGLEEVSLISSIIMRLAKAAVATGEPVVGPELVWLAKQLDRAALAAKPSEFTLN